MILAQNGQKMLFLAKFDPQVAKRDLDLGKNEPDFRVQRIKNVKNSLYPRKSIFTPPPTSRCENSQVGVKILK